MRKLLIIFNFLLLPKIVWRNWFLLWQMTNRNIASRYRGSALGLVWSLIQPLMMLCVYTFVFSIVFKARWGLDAGNSRGAFAITMFCGMTFFNIFSETVSSNCGVVTGNPNFVKKVIFPLEILPLAQSLSTFILGAVWFFLLFWGTIFIYGSIGWTMLLLPVVVIPLFLFSLGLAYFTASLGVFVRDTQYVVGVILQVMFFMTPIFYPISAVPERFRWPLEMNVLTIMIEEGRKVMLFGQCPNWATVGVAWLVALSTLHFGFLWFYKTKKGFADVI